MTKTYYVGLEVHKETIAIAYAAGGTREDFVYHRPCGGRVLAAERALRKLAEKLDVEFSSLKDCYEAGPTGFVLARRLIRYGLDCILMSPSKTERKPNEKIKTDKRDACKGFQEVAAMTVISELGDLRRFSHPSSSNTAPRARTTLILNRKSNPQDRRVFRTPLNDRPVQQRIAVRQAHQLSLGLYLGDERFSSGALALDLPQPRIGQRRFVLQPLADLRPDLVLPGHERNIAAMLEDLDSDEAPLRRVAANP